MNKKSIKMNLNQNKKTLSVIKFIELNYIFAPLLIFNFKKI